VSELQMSVGECATWIETAARQAVRLEKQAEEIAGLKLESKRLREKVEEMLARGSGDRWGPDQLNELDSRGRSVARLVCREVLTLLEPGDRA
jgi:hypothetical protein